MVGFFGALKEIYKDPLSKKEFFEYLKMVEANALNQKDQVHNPLVLTKHIAAQLTENFNTYPLVVKIAGDSDLQQKDGSCAMVAIKDGAIILSEGIFTTGSKEFQKALSEILIGLVLAKQTILHEPHGNHDFRVITQRIKTFFTKVLSLKLAKRQFSGVVKKRDADQLPLSKEGRAAVLMYWLSARNLFRAGKFLHELTAIPTFEQMMQGVGLAGVSYFANNQKSGVDEPSEQLPTVSKNELARRDLLRQAYDLAVNPSSFGATPSTYDTVIAKKIALATEAARITFLLRRLSNPWQVAEAALWSEHRDRPSIVTPRAEALIRAVERMELQNFQSAPNLNENEANLENEWQMGRLMQFAETLAKESSADRRASNERSFSVPDIMALYFARHVAKVKFSSESGDLVEAARLQLLTKRTLLPLLHRLQMPLAKELGYVTLYSEDKDAVAYLKNTLRQWCGDFSRGGRKTILESMATLGTAAVTGSNFLFREKDYSSVWQKEEETVLEIQRIFEDSQLTGTSEKKREAADSCIVKIKQLRAKLVGASNHNLETQVIGLISQSLNLPPEYFDLVKGTRTREVTRLIKPFASMARNTDTLGMRIISRSPESTLDQFIEKVQSQAGAQAMKLTIDAKEYVIGSCVPLMFPEGRRRPAEGWVIDRYQLGLRDEDGKQIFVEFEVHAMTKRVADTEKSGMGPVERAEAWYVPKLRRFEYSFAKLTLKFKKYAGIYPAGKEPPMTSDFSRNVKLLLAHTNAQGQFFGIEQGDGSVRTIRAPEGTTLHDLFLTKSCQKLLKSIPPDPTITFTEIASITEPLKPGTVIPSSLLSTYQSMITDATEEERNQSMTYRLNKNFQQYLDELPIEERQTFINENRVEQCCQLIAAKWCNNVDANVTELSPVFQEWFQRYYLPLSNFDAEQVWFALKAEILPVDEILREAESFFVISRPNIDVEKMPDGTSIVNFNIQASSGPKGYNLSLYQKRREIEKRMSVGFTLIHSNNIAPEFGHFMKFEIPAGVDPKPFFNEFSKKIALNPIPLEADNSVESQTVIRLTIDAPDNNDTLLEILEVAALCNLSLIDHDSFPADKINKEANALIKLSAKALLPERLDPSDDRRATEEQVAMFQQKLEERAIQKGWKNYDSRITSPTMAPNRVGKESIH